MSGGWLHRELPESVGRDLERRGVPAGAVAAIKFAGEIYRHMRDDAENLSPREIRQEIERLEKMTGELRDHVYNLPSGVDDTILNAGHLWGRANVLEALRAQLADFDQLLGKARQMTETKSGRPGSRRTFLASEIANALVLHDVEPDAKPNGPLCQALGIIFAATGEKGRAGRDEPNPVEIAKTALSWRKNRSPAG